MHYNILRNREMGDEKQNFFDASVTGSFDSSSVEEPRSILDDEEEEEIYDDESDDWWDDDDYLGGDFEYDEDEEFLEEKEDDMIEDNGFHGHGESDGEEDAYDIYESLPMSEDKMEEIASEAMHKASSPPTEKPELVTVPSPPTLTPSPMEIGRAKDSYDAHKRIWPWAESPFVDKDVVDSLFTFYDDATGEKSNVTRSPKQTDNEKSRRNAEFSAVLSEKRMYGVSWRTVLGSDSQIIAMCSDPISFRKWFPSTKHWAKLMKELQVLDGVDTINIVDRYPTNITQFNVMCYDPRILQQVDMLISDAMSKESRAYAEWLEGQDAPQEEEI